MVTNAAVKLINQLRFDPQVREHFSISKWDGKGTCKTVGCIAGTAILQAGQRLFSGISRDDIISRAQRILGIEFRQTATHLFVPWIQAGDLTNWMVLDARVLVVDREGIETARDRALGYLPLQAQPDLSTVEKMLRWAIDYEGRPREAAVVFTPDVAANALEQVTVGEMPFVNWARAEAEAQAGTQASPLKEPV